MDYGITEDNWNSRETLLDYWTLTTETDKQLYRFEMLHMAQKLNGKVTEKQVDQLLQAARRDIDAQNSGSNYTQFTGAEPLKCGLWVCDDSGCRRETEKGTAWAIMHPIYPARILEDIDDHTQRVELRYKSGFAWRSVTVDMLTISDRGAIVKGLANVGIRVTSASAAQLVALLATLIELNEIPVTKCTGRVGWTDDNAFIPYTMEGMAYNGDKSTQEAFSAIHAQGECSYWLDEMNTLRGNSELFRVVLAASFASVLIAPLGANSFILHLWGKTGGGKTVAGMCAASVWGDPDRGKLQWTARGTQNFFSAAAAFLHDLPMYCDEIETVRGQMDLDKLVMQLTEGIDKGRSNVGAGIAKTRSWHNAFITTGEGALSGGSSGGGVKNRIVEVQLPDGKPLVPDGNRTARIVRENYGHAGRIFVECIQHTDKRVLQKDFAELMQKLLKQKHTTEKQAMAMALIVLASNIACACIFHDAPLTVEQAAKFMLDADDVDVATRAWNYTMSLIDSSPERFDGGSGTQRGERWGKYDSAVSDRSKLYFNKEILRDLLTKKGFEFESVVSAWAERGKLVKSQSGRNAFSSSVDGAKGYFLKLIVPKETVLPQGQEQAEPEKPPF